MPIAKVPRAGGGPKNPRSPFSAARPELAHSPHVRVRRRNRGQWRDPWSRRKTRTDPFRTETNPSRSRSSGHRWALSTATRSVTSSASSRARKGRIWSERLSAARSLPTRRWGWWLFEAGDLRYPGRDLERSTLFEAGLLGDEEEAELLADWRCEFDRAHGPNFFHCASGKILRGEAARHAHLKWADIPPALVEEWSAEHDARASLDGRDQTTTATAGRCVS